MTHRYWELTHVSTEELREWKQALRSRLAEPQRELRAVNHELNRRQSTAPQLPILSLFGLAEPERKQVTN
jgi:hypothetical protein